MLLLVILAIVVAIRIRLLNMPLERDEGEYAYAGQLLLQGTPPYQEVYNMKWPGVYAAYALIMAMFGQTAGGIHAGLILVNLATAVLVFGRQIEAWMIDNSVHELRHYVLFFWRMVRWAVALVTGVIVLVTLYHFGTSRKEHWAYVRTGAITATLVWFPSTLAFGWYVTRIADYSMFYGSFGAGIATLVWLYITSFSALLGAELNGVLFRERKERASARAKRNRSYR